MCDGVPSVTPSTLRRVWPFVGPCGRAGKDVSPQAGDPGSSPTVGGSDVETLIIYKLSFNQNHYTFALILLIKIVLCSKFH